MKRLVLAGGGHAHVEVLRRFAHARPDAEVWLVTPDRYTAYSGMLPGVIAGHYRRAESHIDVEYLAERAHAKFIRDRVTRIDPRRKTVDCANGQPLSYDLVSLDIGSISDTAAIHGAEHFGLAVRPVEQLLDGIDRLVPQVQARATSIAVAGAGAGGVELCMALQYRLAQNVSGRTRLALITASDEILPGYSAVVKRRVVRVLVARGVELHIGRKVVGVTENDIVLDNATRLPAGCVIWATGPAPAAWVREGGLHTDRAGFLLVDDCLRSLSHPDVFAAGDIATMVNHPRPKSGVYAVRHGPVLACNLRLALSGRAPRPFDPQRRALQLITTGNRYAVAVWGNLSFAGGWVWRWKDWIDRRFIARYARV